MNARLSCGLRHGWAALQPAVRCAYPKPYAVVAMRPGSLSWRALSSMTTPAETSASPAFIERAPAAERPAAAAKKPRVKRVIKAVIEVTDRAKARLAEIIGGKDPAPVGIRLGVRTRGCNGLSYTMNYVEEAPKLDDVVDAGENVKVFVDPKAVMHLVGSSMDFVEDAVRAEFVFQNPNAKGSCGCGESFNV